MGFLGSGVCFGGVLGMNGWRMLGSSMGSVGVLLQLHLEGRVGEAAVTLHMVVSGCVFLVFQRYKSSPESAERERER